MADNPTLKHPGADAKPALLALCKATGTTTTLPPQQWN